MQHDKFNIHQTPEGHFDRFKNKLHANQQINKKTSSLKWYLVAASLALLVSLWYNFKPNQKNGYELADVSLEMKETQTYFTGVIKNEINKVNLQKDELTQPLINDALKRVNLLEDEYSNLKKELKEIGFEKRIINAMIFNFQQRIEVLEDLLNNINNIKDNNDENNNQNYI
jgi:hypothetical protein